MNDDEDDPWTPAVSLTHDGKIEGIYPPQDQRRPTESWVKPDAPLELDRPAPPPPPPEPPLLEEPNKWLIAAGALALLLLCAGAVFALLHRPARAGPARAQAQSDAGAPATSQRAGDAPVPQPAQPPEDEPARAEDPALGLPALVVQSEPSGATVFIGGEELGRTPLLGSNEFAEGERVQVRLELAGYRPWTGTIEGGVKVSLQAKLRRK